MVRKQQTLIRWRFGSKIDFFPCRTSSEKKRVAPILGSIKHGASFIKIQEHQSPCFATAADVRSFHVFRDLIVCLGVFEMDAKHAKHLRAIEAVDALWSEQESQDATYRITNASIQDSRDEVFQIANVLPQKESSEFLGRDEVFQIANVLPQKESSEFLGPDEVFQIANVLPQKESLEFLELELSQMESRQTNGTGGETSS